MRGSKTDSKQESIIIDTKRKPFLVQSQCGPYWIEYGPPKERQDDDTSDQWEFTMGSMF